MAGILVIGSSNIDLIMKMQHLPQTGETVTDCSFMQTFGGKGANQAVGAARSGGKVTFVSCVGDDAYGKAMIENLSRDHINVNFVWKEQDIPTGTALIMIGSRGENYISVAPGANYRMTRESIDKVREVIKESSLVVLQYEILPDTLEYIVNLCHGTYVPVLLNLAPARKISSGALKKLKYLVVNETEARFLAETKKVDPSNVNTIAGKLLDLGPEIVIITLGESGSYIASRSGVMDVPEFRVTAVDTTAAGDVYCGALATALVENRALGDAVLFASAAAALSVTRLGAQPSAPFRNEIDEFIRKNIKG